MPRTTLAKAKRKAVKATKRVAAKKALSLLPSPRNDPRAAQSSKR